ncbi:RHS repeat-associated core domain-containing protein [soil metagenome]
MRRWIGTVVIGAWLASGTPAAQAGVCPFPGTGGCSSGPAVQASSAPSVSAGNPVNLANGNKYQREVDIVPVDEAGALELVRHYNSRTGYHGLFGYGWRMSYEATAYPGAGSIQIVQADGRRLVFDRDPSRPGNCASAFAEDGTVRESAAGIVWRWPDGRVLTFAASGRLERIEYPSGDAVSLDYDPRGDLLQVSGRRGGRLRFELQPDSSGRRRHVAAVHAPTGTWRYRYDASDRLVEVVPPDRPGAAVRGYLYERDASAGDPYNLTGIALRRVGDDPTLAVRVSTYRYDARDRVVETDSAIAGERLTIAYDEPQRDGSRFAQVTRASGGVARYRLIEVAGQARIAESAGQACESCPGAPRRWSFDAQGRPRFEQWLGEDGVAWLAHRWHRDASGRVLQVDEVRYVEGRPVLDRWIERRRYADAGSPWPSRVSQPSVVAGREHSLDVEWNELGQPLRMTERGSVPDPAALVALGGTRAGERDSSPLAAAVSGIDLDRTVSWRYAPIAGLSRLVEIDGPRTDADDVVRFEYDRHGTLLRRIDPERLVTEPLERDAAGRTIRWRGPDGVVTGRDFDLLGRVIGEVSGTAVTRMQHDLLGRLSSIQLPDGSGYRLLRTAEGEVVRIDDASGASIEVARDAAGAPSMLAVRAADGRAVYGPIGFERDASGRLVRSFDAEDGSSSHRYGYDAAGRLVTVRDAIDRETALQRGPAGDVVAIAQRRGVAPPFGRATSSSDPSGRIRVSRDALGRASVRVDDDFGNRVFESHPDSGVRLYRHDASGAVVASVDSTGRSIAIDRDAAGRVIALGALGEPRRVRLTWQGAVLQSVLEPDQRLWFGHGPQGLRTVQTRDLRVGNAWLRFNTRLEHDSAGRVTRVALPDGHTLESRYGVAGPLDEIRFDDRRVAGDMQWQPFGLGVDGGLHRMTHGNGLATVIDYDHHAQPILLDAAWPAGTSPAAPADLDVRLERDAAGRIVTSRSGNLRSSFRYDDHDQLVEASIDGPVSRRFAYRYDPIGNRIGADEPPPNGASLDADRRLAVSSGRVVASWSGDRVAQYSFTHAGDRFERWMPGDHTVFLSDGGQLTAEADAAGRIRRHYLWVGQRPVALADIGTDGRAGITAVLTDQRGAPTRAIDAARRLRWSADYKPFGAADVTGDLRLDLRLPGQVFDRETGLHHHLHRDYDPAAGRFITSDPVGARGGVNGYAYVRNDPINKTDPTGLFESDVHFYLMYFLAITSGVSSKDARIIALASQYIDDNPLTSPVVLNDDGTPDYVSTGTSKAEALKRYHFVLSDASSGQVPAVYKNANIYEPRSPQLDTLYRAVLTSSTAATSGKADCDADLQLFGEFLHAFTDTFSHRNAKNIPYDAVLASGMQASTGHVADGHNPDITYDHYGLGTSTEATPAFLSTYWGNNEARTIEMAREAKDEFAPFVAARGKSMSWEQLRPWIARFAAVRGDENKHPDQLPAKIRVLAAALKSFGYSETLAWSSSKSGPTGYDVDEAAGNRATFLKGLDKTQYPGIMLGSVP